MDAMTYLNVSAAGKKGRKPNYKNRFDIARGLHPVATDILTLCSVKSPDITTKKNKKSSFSEDLFVLCVSEKKNTKIGYIAEKKLKKCLTFDHCCARNSWVMKMKKNIRRYSWHF